MKRITFLILLVTLFSLVLEGCGPGPSITQSPFAEPSPTDSADETSEPPLPIDDTNQHLNMQENNTFARTKLETKPSGGLADTRIGGNAETIHIDSRVWNAGIKWMRVIIDSRGQWQYVDWAGNEYAIDPDDERIIDDLSSKGIKIMLVLDVWHTENRTVYYKTDEDIATYTNWVRFMIRHFKGRIEYYEILNEPNLDFNSPSGMPVDAYANLVRQTVPVIREEDPEAKIVVGAVPDTRFNDARNWIWGLFNSGIMPLVDGFSWHGMYGAAPSDDLRGERQLNHSQVNNYWEDYPDYVKELKSVAADNGFEGEFMTEEMLWRTPKMPHETEPDGFTDISAAKYYARSIIIHLGLDVSPGLALPPDDDMPRSYSAIRAISTVMAGAQPVDIPVSFDDESSNIKYYGFALPNGEKLLAIWTDGAAVEDDPGIPLTITFPDFSAERVTGLDVLDGIEQQIVTEDEGGNLVIHSLLVKDYPVILRITP